MSVPNRVSTVTHGATSITGITGFSISTDDTMEPVHVDNDEYNSYNNVELGGIQITLEGTDISQFEALIGATAADLVIVCDECGASTQTTFTLTNAIAVPASLSASAPGSLGNCSMTFAGVGSDGDTEALTIASA